MDAHLLSDPVLDPVGVFVRTRSTLRKRRNGRSRVKCHRVARQSSLAFQEPLLRQLVLEPLLQLCAAFRRQAHARVRFLEKGGPATEGLGARPQHA